MPDYRSPLDFDARPQRNLPAVRPYSPNFTIPQGNVAEPPQTPRLAYDPSKKLAAAAAEAAHGNRVNPPAAPNGRYGLPPNPPIGGYTGSSATGAPNGQPTATAGTQTVSSNTAQEGGLRQGSAKPVVAVGNTAGVSAQTMAGSSGSNGLPGNQSLRRALATDLGFSREAWAGKGSRVIDAVKNKLTYQPAAPIDPSVKQGLTGRLAGGALRVASGAYAAKDAYDAVGSFSDGRYGDAAVQGLDSLAGAAIATKSPLAVPATYYLGAKAVASGINSVLPDNAKDWTGSVVNSLVPTRLGRMFGQEWGVDSEQSAAYNKFRSEDALRKGQNGTPFPTPVPTAQAPKPTAPVDPNNPHADANAAKLAAANRADPEMATNASAAKPDPSQALRNDPFANKIVRDGNSFSGSNIGLGAETVDTAGNTLAWGGRTGGVSPQNEAAAQAMSDRYSTATGNDNMIRAANLRDGVDLNRGTSGDTAPQVQLGRENGYGLRSPDALRRRELQMDASSTKSNMESRAQHAARTGAAANALQAMDNEQTSAPRMEAERNNQLRIHQMQNETSLRNQQMQNATTMRGQDMTYAGHKLSTGHQANSDRLRMMSEERKYNDENRKYEAGRSDKAFEQRQQATKDLHAEIGFMLPPGADGKPDLATAAKYATGLTAQVAGAADQYRRQAAADPNNPKAKDWLDTAARYDKGVGVLSASDKQRFMAGMMAKDTEAANHSTLNPFGGTAVKTNAPVASLKWKDGVFSNSYISTHTDGSKGEIPASQIDGGWFSPRNTQYDSLKVK